MAPSRSIELRGSNTLTGKIPYRRMPRGTIVVELSRKHLSIAVTARTNVSEPKLVDCYLMKILS